MHDDLHKIILNKSTDTIPNTKFNTCEYLDTQPFPNMIDGYEYND
jgi:hypothetical protein